MTLNTLGYNHTKYFKSGGGYALGSYVTVNCISHYVCNKGFEPPLDWVLTLVVKLVRHLLLKG